MRVRIPQAVLVGVAIFIATSRAFAQAADVGKLPAFADFPVTNVFKGIPAKLKFPKDPKAWLGPDPYQIENREDVEFDAEKGPNFAGRFTIAQGGCGTYCIWMAVVDAPTGRLYPAYPAVPFGTLSLEAGNGRDYEGLTYRLESSLLIVEGCLDVEEGVPKGHKPDCSRSYYNWQPPKFRLLRKISLPIPEWLKEYQTGR